MMKNKSLQLLFMSNGLFVLAGNLIGPLYAVYAQKFSSDIFSISLSWALYLLSATVFTFVMIKVGDKYRKDYFFAAGFLIRACVWAAFIFINTLPQLMLLQILLGVGEAVGTSSFQAIFAEHLDRNHHVKDYASWQLISNMVMVVGTIGGGIVVKEFGFSYLFFLMFVLALLAFWTLFLRRKKINLQ